MLLGGELRLVIFELLFDFLDVLGQPSYFFFQVVEVLVKLLNVTN